MSTDNFVKGECRACGGHLEFPAEAAGETIECPHCGKPTKLAAGAAPNQAGISRRKRLAIAVALFLAAVVPTLLLVLNKPHAAASSALVTKAVSTNTPAAPAVPADEIRTNDFAVSAIRLEKTPGSSLVYVTGKIRNLGDSRRFGVRVELNLFDKNARPIGLAKDYQPLLEPGAEWHFKAMVMESKVVSARLNSIHEEQ
jgi:hypothetical protein